MAAVAFGLIQAGGGVWDHLGGWDLHGAFLPKYIEAPRALFEEGRLPLWNPYEFCGAPLFATIQGLILYPPVPILFAFLPPFWALQGLYAVNLLILAWGVVVYLRKHDVGRPAAVLAFSVSVAGCFTSYASVGLDHPNFLASMAWLPWMLFCLERAYEKGARPWLGLFALTSALQWLAGYPDFPIDTAVLLGAMAWVVVGGTWHRRLTFAVCGVVLGTALAGLQVLPLVEALGQSTRGREAEAYEVYRQGFRVLSAGTFDFLVVGRLGLAGMALAAFSLIHFSRARLSWLVATLWAIFALEPPLGWLYLLPGLSGVRNPLGWSHLFPMTFGFLASAGAWSVWTRGGWPARALAVVLSLAALVPWMHTVYRLPSMMKTSGAPDYELLAWRASILRGIQKNIPGNPRVLSQLEMDSGTMSRERIPSAGGYDPTMPTERVRRVLNRLNGNVEKYSTRAIRVNHNPEIGSLLGVGLLVVDQALRGAYVKRGYEQVGRLRPRHVILWREPLPRARLVHEVEVVGSGDESLSRIFEAAGDLRRMTVLELEQGTPPPVAPPPEGSVEAAGIRVDEPEFVEIVADVVAPALLVLTDTHYPGWTAAIDGEPTEILRADYAFRAVALPPGRHVVTFRYQPLSFRLGVALSLLAGLLTLWLLVPAGRRSPEAVPVARGGPAGNGN